MRGQCRGEWFEHRLRPGGNGRKKGWQTVGLANLLLDLPLVFEKRFQGLIKVFFDEIFDQLVVHAYQPDKQRYRKRIKLWRVEFEDELGQARRRDIGARLCVNNPDVIAL